MTILWKIHLHFDFRRMLAAGYAILLILQSLVERSCFFLLTVSIFCSIFVEGIFCHRPWLYVQDEDLKPKISCDLRRFLSHLQYSLFTYDFPDFHYIAVELHKPPSK